MSFKLNGWVNDTLRISGDIKGIHFPSEDKLFGRYKVFYDENGIWKYGSAETSTNNEETPGSYAGYGCITVLPIKLISFSVNNKNGYDHVSWDVASELNLERYEVYKSNDGKDWRLVSTLSDEEVGHNITHYKLYKIDSIKNSMLSYYKLISIDYDGHTEEFGPVSNGLKENIFDIYPNPMNDKLNVIVEDNYKIEIYSMNGKLVYSDNLIKGLNVLYINLNKGIYYYKVVNEYDINSGKLIRN